MRVVLDTNILARAASGPPSIANELVLACMRAPHDLVLSPFILLELSRVLRYDRVRLIHGMNDEGIDRYIADLQAGALMIVPRGDAQAVVSSDANDDPIIATAVAAQADAICTLDHHIRAPEVVAYCRDHRVEVLTDLELIKRFRSKSPL